MKEIKVQCPTRVDLSGGTVDLWPLSAFLAPCYTINAAIDVKTQVNLELRNDDKIQLNISDLNFMETYKNLQHLLEDKNPKIRLLKAHLEYWYPEYGLNLTTKSESPVGGGLGGSSSLCISLIEAFNLVTPKLKSIDEKVYLAHNIEAQILNVPTGTQDYYPPLLGGVCRISYELGGTKIEKYSSEMAEEISNRLLVVYTGEPHHSGLNNWKILKSYIEGEQATIDALHRIKEIALEMDFELKANNWSALYSLYDQELQVRKTLASGYVTDGILKLESWAKEAGAKALKVCGAGGGGCVAIWTDIGNKDKIFQRLESLEKKGGFKILKDVKCQNDGPVVESH